MLLGNSQPPVSDRAWQPRLGDPGHQKAGLLNSWREWILGCVQQYLTQRGSEKAGEWNFQITQRKQDLSAPWPLPVPSPWCPAFSSFLLKELGMFSLSCPGFVHSDPPNLSYFTRVFPLPTWLSIHPSLLFCCLNPSHCVHTHTHRHTEPGLSSSPASS